MVPAFHAASKRSGIGVVGGWGVGGTSGSFVEGKEGGVSEVMADPSRSASRVGARPS
jgi:hypothetical protein